jgi:hypothetical protein
MYEENDAKDFADALCHMLENHERFKGGIPEDEIDDRPSRCDGDCENCDKYLLVDSKSAMFFNSPNDAIREVARQLVEKTKAEAERRAEQPKNTWFPPWSPPWNPLSPGYLEYKKRLGDRIKTHEKGGPITTGSFRMELSDKPFDGFVFTTIGSPMLLPPPSRLYRFKAWLSGLLVATLKWYRRWLIKKITKIERRLTNY